MLQHQTAEQQCGACVDVQLVFEEFTGYLVAIDQHHPADVRN